MDEKAKHYIDIILEDVNRKFDIMMEGLTALAPLVAKVDRMDERLTRVEDDVKVMKQVLMDQSKILNNHEGRITRLEA